MKKVLFLLSIFIILKPWSIFAEVQVGLDRIFVEPSYKQLVLNKKIGLLSHNAAISKDGKNALISFLDHSDICSVKVVFTLEHGFYGNIYSNCFGDNFSFRSVPVIDYLEFFSLPDKEILKDLDVIVVDIQDIGSRCYTFINVLYKCMKECEKYNIPIIVLDRPNPINGLVVDGPIVKSGWESLVGTEGVPLCHGMTVCELAQFFRKEKSVNCELHIVPMKGWRRSMTFEKTLRTWIPTSPQIPEASTASFYSMTGLIGHCSLTNIGIGYTLPFKVVAAPWIDELTFAKQLNDFKLPGISFVPFHYTPFFGKFKQEVCRGVYLVVTDPEHFYPVETQFVIISVLKSLYPRQFQEAMNLMLKLKPKVLLFNQITGDSEILDIIMNNKYIVWPLRTICKESREKFGKTREPYLITDYKD